MCQNHAFYAQRRNTSDTRNVVAKNAHVDHELDMICAQVQFSKGSAHGLVSIPVLLLKCVNYKSPTPNTVVHIPIYHKLSNESKPPLSENQNDGIKLLSIYHHNVKFIVNSVIVRLNFQWFVNMLISIFVLSF